MARIGLKKESAEAPHHLKVSSFGKVPFTFDLDINLKEQAEQQTEVSMTFNGDIKPFHENDGGKAASKLFQLPSY